MTLLENITCLVTGSAHGGLVRVRAAMRELGVVENGAVLFDNKIVAVGSGDHVRAEIEKHGSIIDKVVDCTGKTVMPGFVDAHTHMVFAGSRAQEFARRLAGVPYTQIASEGGGILTTMRAVRESSVGEIAATARRLVQSAIRHGTTTLEIKSGYGLSTEAELKLLEAAARLRDELPIEIHITFLGAHDVPPEYRESQAPYRPDDYVQLVVDEMLPAVKAQGIATACDVFVDQGFFSARQGQHILVAAKGLGFALHVHADEIANIGASALAARMGAWSADHLEFTSVDDMELMCDAGVVAVLLPGTAFTLLLPYPDARTMITKGLVVALATDCNPGSSYSENMQKVLSLACANMGMSIEEAITAATLHGAQALRIANRKGSL
jgi:imidazolonepropionase